MSYFLMLIEVVEIIHLEKYKHSNIQILKIKIASFKLVLEWTFVVNLLDPQF